MSSDEDAASLQKQREELAALRQEQQALREVVTAEITRIMVETHELAVQLAALDDELSIFNDDISNLKLRKTEFSTTIENNSRLHRQMAQALEANAAAKRLAEYHTELALQLAKQPAAPPPAPPSQAASPSEAQPPVVETAVEADSTPPITPRKLNFSAAESHLDTDSYVRRQAEEFEKKISEIRNSLMVVKSKHRLQP